MPRTQNGRSVGESGTVVPRRDGIAPALIASREDLVARLGAARQAKHLSIRALASKVGVPASTMQGWLDGRHLPTPALRGQFLEMLGLLGLVDAEHGEAEWVTALAGLAAPKEQVTSPYVGLRPYSAVDGALYFGRERTVDELVEAILDAAGTDQAVFVIGASGAGKSSLLAGGLLGQAVRPGGRLAGWQGIRAEPGELGSVTPAPDTPGVVVIDQLEEHLGGKEADRRPVFDALLSLPDHVVGVVGLRADAFGLVLADERLRRSLAEPVLLGPLTREEFRQIITAPAAERGRPVTAELEQLVLRDLYAFGDPAPGMLPLLSSALLATWTQAAGERPDVGHYLAAGGLWGGLEQLAESIFDSLDPELQARVKPLLLSLVQLSPERISRRWIPLTAVPDDMADVLTRLVNARLLTLSDDEVTISHDSLLLHWPRLAGWLEEERDFLALVRQLQMAASVWEDAARSPQALMPMLGLTWTAAAEDRRDFLTDREHDYLAACRAQTELESDEQQDTIRRLRRRNLVAMTAATLALVMLVVAGVSTLRIDSFRDQADTARAAAQSRQLALISQDAATKDPNVAAQFALAGVRVGPTRESMSAVLEIAGAPVPLRTLGPPGTTIARSTPDAALIARADGTGHVTLWRDRDFTAPVSFSATAGQLFA
ncbi:MAG: hypothetical protein Q4F67_11485, partial [Propionibacteriaceae bacterium]|nr:hypothetical protein [Propionibacteriaceae bacterium]